MNWLIKKINRKMATMHQNGNIFRITCPLCGEFTSHWWIPRTQRPVTQSFDVIFDLRLNKRLSKQQWLCESNAYQNYKKRSTVKCCIYSIWYIVYKNPGVKQRKWDSRRGDVLCIVHDWSDSENKQASLTRRPNDTHTHTSSRATAQPHTPISLNKYGG